MLKRIFAFLLALVMLAGTIPMTSVHAHAEETDGLVAESIEEITEPTEETTEATEETTEATEETTEATEETTEATEETTEATEETTEVTEEEEQTAPEIPDFQLDLEELGLPSDEEVFAAYVEQQFYGTEIATFGTSAGRRLTGNDKVIYNAFVTLLKQVASGARTDTTISIGQKVVIDGKTYIPDIEASFTGTTVNGNDILIAILTDLPYEHYWFDKTTAIETLRSIWNGKDWTYLEFGFTPAETYRGSTRYSTNQAKTSATKNAVARAQSVVAQYAGDSDFDKLLGYKNWICANVSYNDDAANDEKPPYYSVENNPWQLIWAFDDNPYTTIVCEGYAKAFMYLCDLSTFSGDVSCVTVSGNVWFPSGKGGGHMWNVVSYNGRNYLVDVTNTDDGTYTEGSLFMTSPTSGSITGGYYFRTSRGNVIFEYRDTTQHLWGTGSDSKLYLSTAASSCWTHSFGSWYKTTNNRCTEEGQQRRQCSVCYIYDYQRIAPTEHNFVNGICTKCENPTCAHKFVYSSTQVKATCVATGVDLHKCKYCGEQKTVTTNINSSNHTLKKTTVKPKAGMKGYDLYTCQNNCGYTKKSNYKKALALSKPSVKDYVLMESGKPYLTIKPVTGATKYYVYRATSKKGKYKYLGSTSKTRSDNGYYYYQDTKASVGKTYYYKVKAVSPEDVKSSYSSVVDVRCICATPTVTTWKVDAASGKLYMKWKKVSGAKKYEIYRATSKTGTYKKIKTTKGTSFVDSTGTVGKTYYYKLIAVASKSYNNSTKDYYSTKNYGPYYGYRCCARADLTVKAGNDGYANLSWKKVAGAARYYVFRASDAQGTDAVNLGYVEGTFCRDIYSEFGKTYYYSVYVQGAVADTDNGTCSYKKVTVTCSQPNVSIKLSSNKPKLSWNAVFNAQEYVIYRSTSKSGSYTEIARTTSLSYRDKNTKKGKTYYYKVMAIGPIAGTNSPYSSYDSIKSK